MYSINSLSTGFSHKDYLNLQSENEKLQKEKSAMESQLVIYKLKYAESSSSLMEAEDNRLILKKKNEDILEKLKVKDEIIKNIVNERDNIREAYLTNSNINRSETFHNYQSSNSNTNNISMTQRNPLDSNNNNGNYHTAAGNKISITQLQNKDKQMRKMTNPILENNGNRSILSRNAENLENRNIFDLEKSSSINEDNNNHFNNNNKQHNKDYNFILGIGNSNENLSVKTNANNTARKSGGIMGSIKNLFGDKSKKTSANN
jgi:hypothetical protein